MSSTFGGINTVTRGLAVHQVSLDTVGHNVSNASTTGYSRQVVTITTTNPETIYTGAGTQQKGTGAVVQSVARVRDFLIDKQMWQEKATLSRQEAKGSVLSKVENIINDTSDSGIQSVLNDFWESWQSLATNASDEGVRMTVRQRGGVLADAVNTARNQLMDTISDINTNINTKVQTANQITSELLNLNKEIRLVEAQGTDVANDLRDRRDLLVDQLSEIMNVSVTEDANGSYIIQGGGTTLVSATDRVELGTVSSKDPDYGYEIVKVVDPETGLPMNFNQGELAGLMSTRDSTTDGVKGYLNNLSTISQFLLTEFNEVHRTGYGTDGSTGNNFFGQGGDGAADPDYSDPAVSGTFTKGQWIDELKVNQDLFDKTSGLARIAAKKNDNTIVVTQSNVNGGKATVTAKTGTYTSDTPTAVRITIASGSPPAIDSISYVTSTDGGQTWSDPPTTIAGGGPYTITSGGLTVEVAIDDVATTGNANGDTYTFSLSKGNTASGDNAALISNRLKTDSSALLGNASLDSYYSTMISNLGIQTQNTQREVDNQQALVDQINNWREQVSGVSLDEELTNMIKFQKGYVSVARVLTAMDEMLEKLINGTGVVGR
ncbi:hypothetical protein P22_0504 [Propionispora sp. 2/2-37]|uniref:flagellar hook-associated protein FlgK n=1 Tax=Propionispora sp. 2/2-37 TaxID=1677858 RepID=UPI0006BB8152|nr:flagellar hook-associated protein FlgK [Propionispora sp. 2/2-37]CUH94438.1 hypothetical protein P22_0504 [Propionispora sp. 2/2-37]